MSLLALFSVCAMATFIAMSAFALARASNLHARRMAALCALLALTSLLNALAIDARHGAEAAAWNRAGALAWGLVLPTQLLTVLGLARRVSPGWGLHAAAYGPSLATALVLILDPRSGVDAMVPTTFGWSFAMSGFPFVTAMIAGYLLVTVAALASWRWRARDLREKRQAAWLLGSGVAALGASAVYSMLNPMDAPVAPRTPHLFSLIWAGGYAVAVMRYDLMELSPSLALDHVLAAMQDLFLLLDRDGRIFAANGRSATLLGRPPASLRGRTLESLAVDPEAVRGVLEGLWTAKGPGRVGEVSLQTVEGAPVPVLLAGGPILGVAGELVGMALVAQDQRPVRELVKAERMESVGVLAGGIAHDFNNLLTGIAGYLELARSDAEPDSVMAGRLAEAGSACGRAVELTRQLLTFARGGEPIRRPTCVAQVILDSATFAVSGSAVRLESDLAGDLWMVDADPGQLSRVCHNLVLNAVQAQPGGGTVRVHARNVPAGPAPTTGGSLLEGADRVRFTVSDEGPGIPEEHLPRLFEPFFTTRPTGTGLGLAVAHSIVRRHGGEISVESGPGRGTTFRVDLPRGRLRKTAEIARVPEPRNRRRVLVMDDQALVRQVAVDMLGKLGCESDTCADGDEAIRLHRDAREAGRPYDAAVLDLTVPGHLGGAAAAREIRRVDPEVRLIVSSGYAEDAVMAGHREHGFDAVLPKPYSLDGLRAAVEGGAQAPL